MSGSVGEGFRTVYQTTKRLNWFPGHMAKGLKQIKDNLNQVNLVVEVRDARVPFSSINAEFEKIVGSIARVVVYNKADLIPQESRNELKNVFKRYANQDVLLTNSKESKSLNSLINHAKEISKKNSNINSRITAMVVGMPNVGKSTVINALRHVGVNKGKAAKTGSNPGVTKSLSTIIKVLESPEVYIYDTPGVMIPYIPNPINSLKVALTGGIRDDVAELETMADYLLFRLNNFGNTKYIETFKLEAPTDDLEYFLEKVAKRIGALQPGGIPNTTLAAQFFIQQYRRGSFGQYCLDDINESSVLEALGLINKSDDISKNQLKKQEKEARKAKSLEKFKRAKEKSS